MVNQRRDGNTDADAEPNWLKFGLRVKTASITKADLSKKNWEEKQTPTFVPVSNDETRRCATINRFTNEPTA